MLIDTNTYMYSHWRVALRWSKLLRMRVPEHSWRRGSILLVWRWLSGKRPGRLLFRIRRVRWYVQRKTTESCINALLCRISFNEGLCTVEDCSDCALLYMNIIYILFMHIIYSQCFPLNSDCTPNPCFNGGVCSGEDCSDCFLPYTCECANTGFVGDRCSFSKWLL